MSLSLVNWVFQLVCLFLSLLFVCWVGVWGFDVPFAGGLGVGGFGVCLLGHWLQCLLTW